MVSDFVGVVVVVDGWFEYGDLLLGDQGVGQVVNEFFIFVVEYGIDNYFEVVVGIGRM